MRLPKRGDNLWHLYAKHAVDVCERRAMRSLVALVPLGCMSPDLNAPTRKRRAIARAPSCANGPEAGIADPLYDGRTGSIIVGATSHRRRGCKRLRAPRYARALCTDQERSPCCCCHTSPGLGRGCYSGLLLVTECTSVAICISLPTQGYCSRRFPIAARITLFVSSLSPETAKPTSAPFSPPKARA